MKILFLMLNMSPRPDDSNLYSDLAFEYAKNNHEVTIIAGSSETSKDRLQNLNGCRVLWVKTMKQKGVKSVLKKGLAQVLLPWNFRHAYNKFFNTFKFDVVFMPTPPITLIGFVNYIKKKCNPIFYLILRDIYPQGAADLGLVKGKWMYKYLRNLEKRTYTSADIIGCMSEGNIKYIQEHNKYINPQKLKLLPNWQKTQTFETKPNDETSDIFTDYNLENKFIVLFGGTIGYAQKVENIVILAEYTKKYPDVRIVVIGQGVKKQSLVEAVNVKGLKNIIFIDRLPREKYLNFAKRCNIGLITIDERFTVPTIPSKMVAYFNLGLPVMAIVDPHTDFPQIIEEAKAGLCSIGGDNYAMYKNFDKLYTDRSLRHDMSTNGFLYFKENLTVEKAYEDSIRQIMELKYRDN